MTSLRRGSGRDKIKLSKARFTPPTKKKNEEKMEETEGSREMAIYFEIEK